MQVKVGISNRHLHLTEEDYYLLFDEKPNIIKQLSQKGQYASDKTVTIKTEKAKLEKVRVLLPFRSYTQLEISRTDAYTLGLDPPIKDSGSLEDAQEVTIETSKNKIERKCCIIPTRHIHITLEEKQKYQLKDVVKIKVNTNKPTILENVKLKTNENFCFELHLDTDDANATNLKQGMEVEIINE